MRWGSSPYPLAGFKVPKLRGRRVKGEEGKEGKRRDGREKEGRKCRVPPPTFE